MNSSPEGSASSNNRTISYYRLYLGQNHIYSPECLAGSFIGVDYGIHQDLTSELSPEWRPFNRKFIPVYLAKNPGKSRAVAGLACGAIWNVARGMQKGDTVLCPTGEGSFSIGIVSGDYYYQPEGILPHRRPVQWLDKFIDRTELSPPLLRSIGAAAAVINVTPHHEEIERILKEVAPPQLVASDPTVQDVYEFAMEQHLEEFLVKNWSHTPLGRDYDLFLDENGNPAQQYPTDTGELDILAISKDRKTLLVIELKKGRAADVVVGQILRYMGFVKESLAEDNQQVKGIIIAHQDDLRIQRALVMTPHIDFYHYHITFTLARSDHGNCRQP